MPRAGLGYMIELARTYGQTEHHPRRPRRLRPARAASRTASSDSSRGGPCHGVARWRTEPKTRSPCATWCAASIGAPCSTASISTSRAGEFVALLGPQRLGQEHAAAGTGRSRPRRRSAPAGWKRPTTCPWCSRTRGCCRGSGCWTMSSLGLPATPMPATRGKAALAEVGLAGRETAWPVRAVRRRAAARGAGPLAGARSGAAAGRRAVRRARRADPDSRCTACCASSAIGTSRRCCW